MITLQISLLICHLQVIPLVLCMYKTKHIAPFIFISFHLFKTIQLAWLFRQNVIQESLAHCCTWPLTCSSKTLHLHCSSVKALCINRIQEVTVIYRSWTSDLWHHVVLNHLQNYKTSQSRNLELSFYCQENLNVIISYIRWT